MGFGGIKIVRVAHFGIVNFCASCFNIEGFYIGPGRFGSIAVAVEKWRGAAGFAAGAKIVIGVDATADRGAFAVEYKHFQPDTDHVLGCSGGSKAVALYKVVPSSLLA